MNINFKKIIQENLVVNTLVTAFIFFMVIPAFISAKSTMLVWIGIAMILGLIAYHLNFLPFKSPVNKFIKEKMNENKE